MGQKRQEIQRLFKPKLAAQPQPLILAQLSSKFHCSIGSTLSLSSKTKGTRIHPNPAEQRSYLSFDPSRLARKWWNQIIQTPFNWSLSNFRLLQSYFLSLVSQENQPKRSESCWMRTTRWDFRKKQRPRRLASPEELVYSECPLIPSKLEFRIILFEF